MLQLIFLPIFIALLVFVIGRRLAEKTGWINCITLGYMLLLCLTIIPEISNNKIIVETYDWAQGIGLNLTLQADGLSLPVLFTIILLSTVISVYSMPYMKHRIEDRNEEYGLFYSLYLLYVSGMIGAVLSINLLSFYSFFELMLIPSFLIILKWGYGERERISLMYFLWTHVGALLLLGGILFLYATSGSFGLKEISAFLIQNSPSQQIIMGVTLTISIGLMTKMAIFGVHIWLPHAHAEAPAPLSALLSPAMIGIGGYAIVRIVTTLFLETFKKIRFFFLLLALITIVYGSLMALAQDDLKRLLAYSSMSQMGYILFGIASQSVMGISGSIFHYVSHGLSKGILFMVAGTIILQTEELRDMNKMGGLSSRMPLTTIAAILGFLGIIGVPPTSGFQSEWMLFSGVFHEAIRTNSIEMLLITFGGILATFLTASYALWTIRKIFFGKRPEYLDPVKEAPFTVAIPMLVLSIMSIIFGLFPSIIFDFLLPSIASIV